MSFTIAFSEDEKVAGAFDIDDWEQWFDDSFFEEIASEEKLSLKIIKNLPYENDIADGLFSAWILKKGA